MRWLEDLRKWLENHGEERARLEKVTIDDRGLRYEFRKENTFIPWSDVSRIYARMTDSVTVDTVWIAVTDGSAVIHVSEDNSQFKELAGEIDRRFATKPGWLDEVSFPPFSCKTIVVFDRDQGSALHEG